MTPPSPCGWTRSTPASGRCSTISPRRCRASSPTPAASRMRPSASAAASPKRWRAPCRTRTTTCGWSSIKTCCSAWAGSATRPTGTEAGDAAVATYTRTPYLIVTREEQARKDVYGSVDDSVVVQSQLLRSAEPSRTAFIAMHPIGSPGYLPMFSNLARVGHHVVACATRYSNGDAALQMENVLLDLAACVRDTRERLGYERVVLVGWSGGGSVMATYQAEAERRTITRTAAGEPTLLADTELLPAD